jgi:hypothetical protein
MKIKYLKVGKLFIVYRTHSQQIVYTNKNKSKCYEYIFKTVNYA